MRGSHRSSCALRSRYARPLQVECLEARQLLAQLPTGFTEEAIATGISSATAMEIAPNGDVWVLEQAGAVKRFRAGVTTGDVVGNLSTLGLSSSGERGVLGIAFDPAYATNKQVFIYHTATSPNIHNQISRFTVIDTDSTDYYFSGASTTATDAGSSGTPTRTIVFNLDALSSATNHNGGAIHFGPDGKLYVAVGDNANGANAQTLANLHGKMLRINADGTIPTDNPFYSATTNDERAIWSLGLRNPFTFAFQPGTGRMFINDVGQNTWEEINDGLPGSNYGWPGIEGNAGTAPNAPGTYRGPVYAYSHGSGTTQGFAITGGAFYNPGTQQFPVAYAGDYFFADVVNNWINVIDLGTNNVTRFASNATGVVDLRVGNDGSLYYLSRGSGTVMKVQTSTSLAPNITQEPGSLTLAANANASFSVSVTGTSLVYQWQRRDGANWVNVANSGRFGGATTATLLITGAQSADAGDYRVVVTNAHGSDTSSVASLTVTANQPPAATINIDGGLSSGLFIAGQAITFSGAATDVEDGALGSGALTWRVDYITSIDSGTPLIRPFIADFSGVNGSSFTPATTGPYTLADVMYRITLTARDSGGLQHVVTRDIAPRVATVTIASAPSGIEVTVDGQPLAAPHSFVGVAGFERPIAAPESQLIGASNYSFTSWSDGGARLHMIRTPETNATFTARYAVINPTAPYQNSASIFDVDNDQLITPLDALLIIIELNTNGARELTPAVTTPSQFWDVSGDNFIAPLDALLVINALNTGAAEPLPSPALVRTAEADPQASDAHTAAVWKWLEDEDELVDLLSAPNLS